MVDILLIIFAACFVAFLLGFYTLPLFILVVFFCFGVLARKGELKKAPLD